MHAKLLDGIPLFAGLSADERGQLARRITDKEVPAGEAVFWIGDAGDECYVVRSGTIQITYPDGDGREVTLAALKPGDFFGEIAIFDGGPRTATARARGDDVTLLCLGREQFLTFITEHPSAAIHIIKVLGKRQRESVDKLRGIKNLNEVMVEHLTHWQRVANAIASMAAGRNFLLIHAIAVVGWLGVNIALGTRGPDPFPFPFLCFWTSCEAIFLSLFILISQDAQSRKDRLRTELEYQAALKTQFEIMQLHRKLDELPASILAQVREMTDADATLSSE
jgi:CRP/FNR family transcriptional regulator, cyclic AMP receptor protein